MENQARTLSGLNVIAGIWLIIAPFILNYNATGNVWQEVVFGIIVGILGLVRLGAPNVVWPSWLNLIIGLWLIVAPWVIPSTTIAARWNEVVVGIIVAILAFSSGAISLQSGEREHAAHQH